MKFINHIRPVEPRKAVGATADVYFEARRDFGRLPEPVVMLSPHEKLLMAGWATLRETLLAGRVPRGRKEAVAAAVAASLHCPWCVDAHTTMLYAAGESGTAAAILAGELPADKSASLVAWARGTAAPLGPPAPFGAEDAAQYIGTALEFHFIARMVLVLLDESFLPGGPRAQSVLRRAGGRAFARKVRTTHEPGLATDRLEKCSLPPDLGWAAADSAIGRSFAALTDCLDTAQHLPTPSREVVLEAVHDWRGEQQPMSSGWTAKYTDGLPSHLRAATRLALLTGLAPYQVTEADVEAARPLLADDADLVSALAWAAWTAARRINSWIVRPAGCEPASGH